LIWRPTLRNPLADELPDRRVLIDARYPEEQLTPVGGKKKLESRQTI
jgi:hypothetical protein